MSRKANTVQLVEAIKDAVRRSGESHYSIGKRAGVDPTIIDRFMAGERLPRVDTAGKIAAALGLELRQAKGR